MLYDFSGQLPGAYRFLFFPFVTSAPTSQEYVSFFEALERPTRTPLHWSVGREECKYTHPKNAINRHPLCHDVSSLASLEGTSVSDCLVLAMRDLSIAAEPMNELPRLSLGVWKTERPFIQALQLLGFLRDFFCLQSANFPASGSSDVVEQYP